MKKAPSKYTAEQLITTYREWKSGKQLADLRKISPFRSSVYMIMADLEGYVTSGKPMKARTSDAYREAVTTLRGGVQPSTNGHVKPVTTNTDNLKKLEEAFQSFQEAIVDVIVAEADKRAKEKVSAKEKELADQKEFYERELIKLQTIITAAKDSSIVSMIKKKWAQ